MLNRHGREPPIWNRGVTDMDDERLRALPKDTPDYHRRQAAHLRALAAAAPNARVKARLSKEADEHDELADEEQEELSAPAT